MRRNFFLIRGVKTAPLLRKDFHNEEEGKKNKHNC